MSLHVANGRWVVWLSLLVAMLFQIMPLPELVEAWRPDWLLLVIIYWAMALPHRYNILTAWVLGVMLDILLGATLGIRAFAMSVVVYVVVLHFQRLRNFPMWQQALLVATQVALYNLIVFWVQFVTDTANFDITLFYPAFSSLIMWPWIFWILRRVRRLYKVR
ncbi:rod shape-determining protein MreD [Shewanella sp. Choline-02u-19]|uniref:rod shape-determining protein MreD n=1 Tax=unclassified Shewanella TaxID=196818 RepID=UPI000C3233C6|nr:MULTISPECIES: rod shape-determining protein MreD [unclassified Shewanella]PKG55751.1 rod shape-determining protein MreD [Shewanella sp. GutDb-MelDb]PKG74937.1 rod shape-determining protein MreD [Shewanella sp. GutCb]PKH58841.1 rod shape-determining protein MreD [Shewanella sp. Bg11-22]PKI29012.1 rod shape-determining protein MreD [Shewanella sp. Choline-02u-19]